MYQSIMLTDRLSSRVPLSWCSVVTYVVERDATPQSVDVNEDTSQSDNEEGHGG